MFLPRALTTWYQIIWSAEMSLKGVAWCGCPSHFSRGFSSWLNWATNWPIRRQDDCPLVDGIGCLYMYVHTYVHNILCRYICTCMSGCLSLPCSFIHAYIRHAYMSMVYMHILYRHTYMHTCTYMYIHTWYMHTCTCTYIQCTCMHVHNVHAMCWHSSESGECSCPNALLRWGLVWVLFLLLMCLILLGHCVWACV